MIPGVGSFGGGMSLGGEGWMRDEFPERYDGSECSFSPYTSNPQLCKSCNRPVTEHTKFLQRLSDKKYAKKRKEMMDLCCREIDAPSGAGNYKMKCSR